MALHKEVFLGFKAHLHYVRQQFLVHKKLLFWTCLCSYSPCTWEHDPFGCIWLLERSVGSTTQRKVNDHSYPFFVDFVVSYIHSMYKVLRSRNTVFWPLFLATYLIPIPSRQPRAWLSYDLLPDIQMIFIHWWNRMTHTHRFFKYDRS